MQLQQEADHDGELTLEENDVSDDEHHEKEKLSDGEDDIGDSAKRKSRITRVWIDIWFT